MAADIVKSIQLTRQIADNQYAHTADVYHQVVPRFRDFLYSGGAIPFARKDLLLFQIEDRSVPIPA